MDDAYEQQELVTTHSASVQRLIAALGLPTGPGANITSVALVMLPNDYVRLSVTQLVTRDALEALTAELEAHPLQ